MTKEQLVVVLFYAPFYAYATSEADTHNYSFDTIILC